jgi:hypothetical protein
LIWEWRIWDWDHRIKLVLNNHRDNNVEDDRHKRQKVDIETHVPNAANFVKGVHTLLASWTFTVNNSHLAIIAFLILYITKLVNLATYGRSVLNLKYFFPDSIVFKHLYAFFVALRGKDEVVKLSNNAYCNEVEYNIKRVV